MLFIFAKRQVMRFALRSRRGPHVSVGQVYIFISQFNSNYLLFLLHIYQHHIRCIKAFDVLCLNTTGKYEAVETRDRSETRLRQLCDSRATGEL